MKINNIIYVLAGILLGTIVLLVVNKCSSGNFIPKPSYTIRVHATPTEQQLRLKLDTALTTIKTIQGSVLLSRDSLSKATEQAKYLFAQLNKSGAQSGVSFVVKMDTFYKTKIQYVDSSLYKEKAMCYNDAFVNLCVRKSDRDTSYEVHVTATDQYVIQKFPYDGGEIVQVKNTNPYIHIKGNASINIDYPKVAPAPPTTPSSTSTSHWGFGPVVSVGYQWSSKSSGTIGGQIGFGVMYCLNKRK